MRAGELEAADLTGVEGFHVHNLCESDSHAAERTLRVVEQRFGKWLGGLKWLNVGGGHLATAEGYDVPHLMRLVKEFQEKYRLEIILEPGAAVAWQTGVLVSEVVDVVDNRGKIAILDISATAHMPDVLEMPYRPQIRGAGEKDEKAHTYRLGGNSCLAGDLIGEYSFEHELKPGDRLVFTDMIHYTMVKTTFFNGVQHPSIGTLDKQGNFSLIRRFGYQDFRNRLS